LWGRERRTRSATALDREVAERHPEFADGLERAGLDMERRPLRVRVHDLEWQRSADGLTLEFQLPRGSFATAVIREVATAEG
jgi:tRNA pseudouridine13 synthase